MRGAIHTHGPGEAAPVASFKSQIATQPDSIVTYVTR
jgi:hypothetical protein